MEVPAYAQSIAHLLEDALPREYAFLISYKLIRQDIKDGETEAKTLVGSWRHKKKAQLKAKRQWAQRYTKLYKKIAGRVTKRLSVRRAREAAKELLFSWATLVSDSEV